MQSTPAAKATSASAASTRQRKPITVVIHGPAGSGKTRHAEKLREHFRCTRIVDEGLTGSITEIRPGDLVLTQTSPDSFEKGRLSCHFVPIASGLKRIGVSA